MAIKISRSNRIRRGSSQSFLKKKGKNVELLLYPGAAHAFFIEEVRNYKADAVKDAWERTLKFFRATLQNNQKDFKVFLNSLGLEKFQNALISLEISLY